MQSCPVAINIPAFIEKIREEDYLGAARVLRDKNALPAISCRVCPQESQCEAKCLLAKKGEACAIGRMARFVTDYERSTGQVQIPEIKPATGKSLPVCVLVPVFQDENERESGTVTRHYLNRRGKGAKEGDAALF